MLHIDMDYDYSFGIYNSLFIIYFYNLFLSLNPSRNVSRSDSLLFTFA